MATPRGDAGDHAGDFAASVSLIFLALEWLRPAPARRPVVRHDFVMLSNQAVPAIHGSMPSPEVALLLPQQYQ
jgi:hypothetical protein